MGKEKGEREKREYVITDVQKNGSSRLIQTK